MGAACCAPRAVEMTESVFGDEHFEENIMEWWTVNRVGRDKDQKHQLIERFRSIANKLEDTELGIDPMHRSMKHTSSLSSSHQLIVRIRTPLSIAETLRYEKHHGGRSEDDSHSVLKQWRISSFGEDENQPALKVALPRGGVQVQTTAGVVQFGLPPETVKDSLQMGLTVPTIFVVPRERFNLRVGISVCEIEFPCFFNFFILKRRVTLITQPDCAEPLTTIMKEALYGPDEHQLYTATDYADHCDPEVRAAMPDHVKEIAYFREPRPPEMYSIEIDSLVSFSFFDGKGRASIGEGVTICATRRGYSVYTSEMAPAGTILEEEEEAAAEEAEGVEGEPREVGGGGAGSVPTGEGEWEGDGGGVGGDPSVDGGREEGGSEGRAHGGTAMPPPKFWSASSPRLSPRKLITSAARLSGLGLGKASPRPPPDDEGTRGGGGAKVVGGGADARSPAPPRRRWNACLLAFIRNDEAESCFNAAQPGGGEGGEDDDGDSGDTGSPAPPPPSPLAGGSSAAATVAESGGGEFVIPRFGLTVLGNSHGFEKDGLTSGFVIWVNGEGIMVDPPPHSGQILLAAGIQPKSVTGTILTHCHADHDAGVFQKILQDHKVTVFTTQTILESFFRKYAAVSGLPRDLIEALCERRAVKVGEPTFWNGAEFRFFYSLHAIPCVGFEATFEGKRIAYSADTYYDPNGLAAMRRGGYLSQARYEALMAFPWDCDIVLHEAGVPPIHTPVAALQALPAHHRRNIRLIHVGRQAALAAEGAIPPLRTARPGVRHTVVLVAAAERSSSRLLRHKQNQQPHQHLRKHQTAPHLGSDSEGRAASTSARLNRARTTDPPNAQQRPAGEEEVAATPSPRVDRGVSAPAKRQPAPALPEATALEKSVARGSKHLDGRVLTWETGKDVLLPRKRGTDLYRKRASTTGETAASLERSAVEDKQQGATATAGKNTIVRHASRRRSLPITQPSGAICPNHGMSRRGHLWTNLSSTKGTPRTPSPTASGASPATGTPHTTAAGEAASHNSCM